MAATVLDMVNQFSKLSMVSASLNKTVLSLEKIDHLTGTTLKMSIDVTEAQMRMASMEKSVQSVMLALPSTAEDTSKAINETTETLEESTEAADKFQEKQQKILKNMQAGKTLISGWYKGITGVVSKFLGIPKLSSIVNASTIMDATDNYTSTQTKLKHINTDENDSKATGLSDKIYASAARGKTSYSGMVSHVIDLETNTSDVFSSNDETIAFTELMQKSFQHGGSSAANQESGISKLIQSMGSGQLEGSDLSLMMKDAPMLADALSSYTGKSKEELVQLAATGAITADILKNSLFSATEEINGQFSGMNASFASVFTVLKDSLLQSFAPIFEMISEKFNGGIFDLFLQSASMAFSYAAEFASFFLNVIFGIYDFFVANWSFIEPIIWGVVAAIAALNIISLISKAVTLAMAAAALYQTIVQTVLTFSTLSLKTAWELLNKAMKGNAFIFIIVAIVGLVAWLIRLWQTNDSFAVALMRIWHGILNFFNILPAHFWQLVEWLLVPFEWWAGSIGKIYDLVINGIIDGINSLLSVVNRITGSSFEIAAKFSFENLAKGMTDFAKIEKDKAYENAALKQQEREQEVLDFQNERAAESAKQLAESEDPEMPNAEQFSGFSDPPGGGGNTGSGPMRSNSIDNIGKVNEVGKIKDTVDISSEDIKMMRELAELNNIQNFVSLTPSVSFGDTHVRNDGDINTIMARITEVLENDIVSSADAAFG